MVDGKPQLEVKLVEGKDKKLVKQDETTTVKTEKPKKGTLGYLRSKAKAIQVSRKKAINLSTSVSRSSPSRSTLLDGSLEIAPPRSAVPPTLIMNAGEDLIQKAIEESLKSFKKHSEHSEPRVAVPSPPMDSGPKGYPVCGKDIVEEPKVIADVIVPPVDVIEEGPTGYDSSAWGRSSSTARKSNSKDMKTKKVMNEKAPTSK